MKLVVVNVMLIICIALIVLLEISFKIMVKMFDYRCDNPHPIENNHNYKILFSSK